MSVYQCGCSKLHEGFNPNPASLFPFEAEVERTSCRILIVTSPVQLDSAMLSSIKVVDKHAADEAFRKEQKALKKQKKKRKKVCNPGSYPLASHGMLESWC